MIFSLEPVVFFKVCGAVFGLFGTLIISMRVTKILDAISNAVESHDINFQYQAARLNGIPVPKLVLYGAGKNINSFKKTGVKLLITGFAFQIIGAICTIVSFVL